MKHIPFTMIIATGVTTLSLAACGGSDLDSEAIQQTAQALASAQESANQTATAVALAGPPTEVDASLAGELTNATPEAEQLSESQLTLAAAATLAAPTIAAGQTLVAQTQAALPTPTPLVLEVVSAISEETIIQDEEEVVVTVVAPPQITLAQAWSQVYAAQVGLPFTITTDEEAMTNTIENTLVSAGYGGNVDNMVVRLNNRLIIVEFSVVFGSSGADGRISFSAFAQDGKAVITMTSLQFGRFTLPPELLEALNFAISFALTGAANANQAQVTINDIFIDNGLMIINGVVGV